MRHAGRLLTGLLLVALTAPGLTVPGGADEVAAGRPGEHAAAPTSSPTPERTKRVYAVVGDSVTAGLGVERAFPAIAGVQAAGYSGRCLTKRCLLWNPLIGDLDVAVDGWGDVSAPMSPRPGTVVLEIGVNDLTTGSGPPRVVAGLRLARWEGRELGLRVLYATLVPPGRGDPRFERNRRVRDRVNAWIRRNARQYVDLDAALQGRQGALRRRYDSGDAVHPNQAGRRAMARELRAFMRADGARARR